ncbi:MAG: trypsin-like peptidase domain-containing protein [Spirochaetaceae bacterium]|jgi:S1-C subfamily serine protease|nr:trypsin-like peptidase domain-containing protein [Spirochaetaceae bacterium]
MKSYSRALVLGAILAAWAVFQAASAPAYTQDEEQNIRVYETCNEAVVNINTQVMAINWFLEPILQEGGAGSGSIIDKKGYVVTNVHVISNANRIYISLPDGSQHEGKVVGSDTASDIAVLKFDPPPGVDLKTIDFGDSGGLKVGQKVIAIGNPFGLERTLTTGIVSGLGRPIRNSNNTIIRDMIQTDAAINPGNSGGPLLDTQGKMIGVNTMIASTSGSSAGVGFAVPINTAKRVVNDLIRYGQVRRGIIKGVLVQLNRNIAQYAKISTTQGLLVSELPKTGGAAKAGLRAGTEAVRYGSSLNAQTIYLGGDIITAIDGVKVDSIADYYSLLESKRPGDTVTLSVLRNGKTQTVKVPLDEQ